MTDTETSERPTIQSHLDLLQQIASESSLGSAGSRKTIAQQLAADLELENAEEVTIPLGTVALFVLVPPASILGAAVATGYVDLFP
ncbi:unnamed protein product [Calypogeia fissa]